MNEAITQALVNYLPLVLPEAVLGVFACLLFLGATFCRGRNLWGGAALVGLGLAAAAARLHRRRGPDHRRSRCGDRRGRFSRRSPWC